MGRAPAGGRRDSVAAVTARRDRRSKTMRPRATAARACGAEEGSMRGSRSLLLALGVAALAGLLVERTAPAAGFTLGGSGSTTSTSTTSGISTGSTTTTLAATPEDVAAALVALA